MIHRLRQWLARPWRLAVALGLYALAALIMAWLSRGLSPAELYALQTTWSPDTFREIMGQWRSNGSITPFLRHFYFDFIYPLCYGALLAALTARAMVLARAGRGADWALWLPPAAVAADWAENIAHLSFVARPALIETAWFYAGPLAGNLKWWLIELSLAVTAWFFAQGALQNLLARIRKKP